MTRRNDKTRQFVRAAGGAVLVLMMAIGATEAAPAQTPQTTPEAAKPIAPKPMKLGDVLSGQLSAIRAGRSKARGKSKNGVAAFQLVSEPRRLPPPSGLCNLETGPETFQIVADGDRQAAQLKKFIGKDVSLKVDEVKCAEEAGVMSEAIVTKWSVVAKP